MKLSRIGTRNVHVSELGFGCASIGNLFAPVDDGQAQDVLDTAWRSGIRYFDTAPYYGGGLSEERLGLFLSGQKRGDYTVSTKVGRILELVSRQDAEDHGFVEAHPVKVRFDYSGDGIMRSLEASLKRLRLETFDIVFIHDIGAATHGRERNDAHMEQLLGSGLRRLEALRAQGVIKAFGVGVNEVAAPVDILRHADLDCLLLANRYTLLDRRAESELLPLCRERKVSIVAGGVFNSGILATGPVAGARFDYAPASADICSRVGRMQKIAVLAGTDLASVALQFPARDPAVVSVLLGTSDTDILKSNIGKYGQKLPERVFEQMAPFALR